MRGGLLALAVLVAGCADDMDTASRDEKLGIEPIPFVDRPATAPVLPGELIAGREVPECTAEQVIFEEIDAAEEIGSGTPELDAPENRHLALSTRPGVGCGLSAYPTLRLTSTVGAPDPVRSEAAAADELPGGRLLLNDSNRVVAIVRWPSSCVPAEAEVRVEGTLAGGDLVTSTPLADRPGCDPTEPNWVGDWLFLAEPPPEGALVAELYVDGDAEVSVDELLRLEIHVLTMGEEPVPLDPCPIYELTVVDAAAFGNDPEAEPLAEFVNELNCPAAPAEVTFGDVVAFTVEMPLTGVPRGLGAELMVTLYEDDGAVSFGDTASFRTTD